MLGTEPINYEKHLEGVSRSFAFCIAQLDEPLKQQISLLYLLCRVLDSVEDYQFKDKKIQFQQMDEFESFFELHQELEDGKVPQKRRNQMIRWAQKFPRDLPRAEADLVKSTYKLIADYYALPLSAQTHFKQVIFEMSEGMQKYLLKNHNLKDLHDLNDYCYYVAGVVGVGLSRLLTDIENDFEFTTDIQKYAVGFGLYLQKINILKDQKEDEADGRYLVPNRDEVFISLLENAHEAFDFLESVPLNQKRFRVFCGWSLFIGLASLPYIYESYEKNNTSKISRLATKRLISKVEAHIDDPVKLRSLFESYIKPVKELRCYAL
ncbi:MAG: squalene/phytoene synthase family protein [Bdellovibrionaceae bacterium]|jgi:phytoene/squalene synthetase|nr:squalene/phytoene synthase family protein [Pseudobdellovibrionaceae bacterium]